MTASAYGAFWTWSLEHYARRGVEPTLLHLQDAFGLNVNIALWACWCATVFEPITHNDMRAAIDATAPWSERVAKPLRAVRRYLKQAQGDSPLRAQIKDAELQAEKAEQAMLEAFAKDRLRPLAGKDSPAAAMHRDHARQNLAAYAGAANPAAADELSSLLESLAGHIFDQPQQPALGD